MQLCCIMMQSCVDMHMYYNCIIAIIWLLATMYVHVCVCTVKSVYNSGVGAVVARAAIAATLFEGKNNFFVPFLLII